MSRIDLLYVFSRLYEAIMNTIHAAPSNEAFSPTLTRLTRILFEADVYGKTPQIYVLGAFPDNILEIKHLRVIASALKSLIIDPSSQPQTLLVDSETAAECRQLSSKDAIELWSLTSYILMLVERSLLIMHGVRHIDGFCSPFAAALNYTHSFNKDGERVETHDYAFQYVLHTHFEITDELKQYSYRWDVVRDELQRSARFKRGQLVPLTSGEVIHPSHRFEY